MLDKPARDVAETDARRLGRRRLRHLLRRERGRGPSCASRPSGRAGWPPRRGIRSSASSVDGEGRYLLELPYADDRELVLDILRHGGEVEVLAPLELRRKVRLDHQRAARLNR